MENEFELSEALERLIKSHFRGFIVVDGVISKINSNNTCTVTVGTTPFTNVPLKVLVNAQASVYEVPVLKSACLMGFRDGDINRPQIISVDQVDKLLINCATLVQYNGGNLGGMVEVINLVTIVNVLQTAFNDLKQIFTDWEPVPDDGGASLKVLITAWAGQMITLTKRGDIEDTSILH